MWFVCMCLYIMDLFCCSCRSCLWIYSQQKRLQFCPLDLIMLELFLWSAVMQVILYLTTHWKQTRNNFCIHYWKPYGQLYWSMKCKMFSFYLVFGWNATAEVIVMIHGGILFNQQRVSISIHSSTSDSCVIYLLCIEQIIFRYYAFHRQYFSFHTK